jgi:tetratricopeptide (TPR) repeat protein
MSKTKVILTALLISGAILQAQQTDPCLEYLKKPTPEGYRAARGHLDSVLSKNSNDRKALLYSALVDRTHLAEQVDRLYNLRDSLEGKYLFGLANLMLETGDFRRSVELYQKLNDQTPKWSCPWRHKGQALYHMGKLAEAEQSLLKAVETRPTHYDAWVWLARVQKDMGKRREALGSIKKAFENKGKDSEGPEEELAAGEDVKLLDEILILNGVKPGKLAAERERITGLSRKAEGERE